MLAVLQPLGAPPFIVQCSIQFQTVFPTVARHPHKKDFTLRGLAKTVSRLTAARRLMHLSISDATPSRLIELRGFGTNPGNLLAKAFVPSSLPDGAPLVVVLHGCTQTSSGYDSGSGWSQLAEREGFALLYPEQQGGNNSNLCFNWYSPEDACRGRGEAKSISQMVVHMTSAYRLDPKRVFVTGLSAGGAMTSVMLATYPELFAGGAIIAGIPFASANTLPEALARMRGQGSPGRSQLAARARASLNDFGPLPTLSVWHGTHDTIVDSQNADWIVEQWRDVHGLGAATGTVERVGQHRREVWRDGHGREVIERYDIRGMGHGTPLATGTGAGCGVAGPHMLEANICSTRRIASFWGLVVASAPSQARLGTIQQPAARHKGRPNPGIIKPASTVGSIIEDALRSAGLMR